MKAILLPIKPKWCALMMNGDKTVEVRKENVGKAVQKLIDEQGFADIYVYCSKGKPNLWLPYEYDCFELDEASQPYLSDKPIVDIDTKMNGKVIFKFRCYKVEELELKMLEGGLYFAKPDKEVIEIDLNEKAQLDNFELLHYAGTKLGTKIFAIHISELEIFDRPKELSEFKTHKTYNLKDLHNCHLTLTKAPQSFCYVEELL